MKIIFKISLFIFLISLCGCYIRVENNPLPLSAYDEVRRDITLGNFDRIRTGNAFKINVLQGNSFRIIATGDRIDINDLDIYVRNGTLIGGYRNNARSQRYSMEIDIIMPALVAVDFSGGTSADVGKFVSNNFDVSLAGASKLNLAVSTPRLTFDISGASQFIPNGSVQKASGNLSGASSYKAYNCLADETSISVSGASDAWIDASKYLKINASGSSNVRYRGNPVTDISTSRASSVVKE